MPSTKEEWLVVSNGFKSKWNYPFCLGALDGKHIAIKQPAHSGSEYFNYKHFFSIILLALVDHNYRFLYVEVGASGRVGDAGLFQTSSLKRGMDEGLLDFPDASELEGTGEIIHYHLIGDDAFPLQKDLIKPYPQRQLDNDKQIFNYRCSRARRVVENAFGILASRFRVFHTKIHLDPEKVTTIVLAACCLHNLIINTQSQNFASDLSDREDEQHNIVRGEWRNLQPLTVIQQTQARNSPNGAKQQRNALMRFFNCIAVISRNMSNYT